MSDPRFTAPSAAPCLLTLLTAFALAPVQAAQIQSAGINQFGQSSVPAASEDTTTVVAGWDFNVALDATGEVDGWGRIIPPADLAAPLSISAGMRHTLAVLPDGKVVGWGSDMDGIIAIPASLGPAHAVAAGAYHSLALLRDGTVRAWGFVGNGRTEVPQGLRNVTAIAAGRDHSLALKVDGTVTAWGLNDMGQCEVPAGLSGVTAIAAGGSHSLALLQDGTVIAWGGNSAGQASVPTGLTGVTAISAGLQHSLALKADGSIQGWGSNEYGQLNLPGTGFTSISAGASHSLALRGGPVLTRQPVSTIALGGAETTLSTASADPSASFQWFHNGIAIPGATDPTLTLRALHPGLAGLYSVQIRNANGTTASQTATLTVRGRAHAAIARDTTGGVAITVADEFGEPISPANAPGYRLMISRDLESWQPAGHTPATLQGKLRFSDPPDPTAKEKFYRIEQD